MWKTALLLMVALVVAPILAYNLDVPLNEFQNEILGILLSIYVVITFLCFIVSTLTDNYSQVDKLWSLIPIAYVWIVAWKCGYEMRIVIMALLVSIWGLRLTFNFARRGGYKLKFWQGDEDYRWSILRAKPGFEAKWKWMAFNLFFISFYQMGLILLFTLPILKSVQGSQWGFADNIITVTFLILIAIETIADQQQWEFHKEKTKQKNKGLKSGTQHTAGFIHSGLWGIVRHPNYAAEQAIWIVFYFFSVTASGNWINWSIMGCLLLILLFKGSSDFSESISSEKYPGYKDYQKKVPRFIPFIFSFRSQ